MEKLPIHAISLFLRSFRAGIFFAKNELVLFTQDVDVTGSVLASATTDDVDAEINTFVNSFNVEKLSQSC